MLVILINWVDFPDSRSSNKRLVTIIALVKIQKSNMINKILLSTFFLGLILLGNQAKADWVIDFGPGLNSGVTSFSFTGDGTKVVDHVNGHTATFTGPPAVQSATIRYEFDGLYRWISNGSDATDEVRFSFDLATSQPEANFFFQGTAERASGGANDVNFASEFFTAPTSGNFEYLTGLTIADIQSDDITALEFDINFFFTSGPGLNNTFTFGGSNGLVAAPEPTSAAMIGCALIGLVARRRRKS